MITEKTIVGSWHLKSFKLITNNKSKDWRLNVSGILIYSPDGYMSVAINSDTKDVEWIDSILFYSGTYRIISNNTIEHIVLNASSKDRIGKNMIRNACFKDSNLILSANGDFGEAVLIWSK